MANDKHGELVHSLSSNSPHLLTGTADQKSFGTLARCNGVKGESGVECAKNPVHNTFLRTKSVRSVQIKIDASVSLCLFICSKVTAMVSLETVAIRLIGATLHFGFRSLFSEAGFGGNNYSAEHLFRLALLFLFPGGRVIFGNIDSITNSRLFPEFFAAIFKRFNAMGTFFFFVTVC